jgi:RNA polymerase sigma factor for flagellar operon FliA
MTHKKSQSSSARGKQQGAAPNKMAKVPTGKASSKTPAKKPVANDDKAASNSFVSRSRASAIPPPALPAPKIGVPAAAKPKKPASSKAKGGRTHPTMDEMRQMPTDDIWVYYRKAVAESPRDEVWLEELRNVLMEMHYPLVKHIAERLLQTLPKSIELDDLVSAGLFGLMDAIRGFDPDRGIKFKTYCTTRIRGSILDQLRSQDWVPRLVRLKAGKIEKALQKLQGDYGREPTHAELANALRMDHVELSKEMTSARAKTMFSLQERWDDRDDDNPMEKVEIVEDRTAVDPIGELNRRDLMIYITRSLTHKERFIIEQYYQVGHTMREIGEMLALTESRVCQIHSNVMSRLKGLLGPQSNSLHV